MNVRETLDLPVQGYPNPATDLAHVRFSNGSGRLVKLELFNYSGSLIETRSTTNNVIELNVSEFAPGMYLLNVTSEKGVASKMLVVE